MSVLPNIHIIGIQGSGKGTQSALIVERYGFDYLASGDLFRQRAVVNDAVGQEIANQMKAGRLLSDELLFKTVEYFLENHSISNGLLGDGVIRTLNQDNILAPLWSKYNLAEPIFINLVLSEESAITRIEQRKSEQLNPAKRSHHQKYGGKLLKREDDNDLAIHERFSLFHKLTEPVINKYIQKGRCININDEPDVETVFLSIAEEIDHNILNK